MAGGFAVSVLGARLLGPAGLGATGVALTIATIAVLVGNGGVNISAIYFLGRRPEQRRAIVGSVMTLGLAGSAVAAAFVFLSSVVILGIVGGIDDGFALASMAVFVAVGSLLFDLGGSLLLGLGGNRPYMAVQLTEAAASVVFTAAILILVTATAAGYVAGAAAAYLVAGGAAFALARRSIGTIRPRWRPGFFREALGMGLRGQVGNLIQFLNLRLDTLLVPVLLSLGSAGVYIVAVRISEAVTQVANAAGLLLFPRVSRANQREAAATAATTRVVILVVGATGAFLAVLAEPLIAVFFGSPYLAGVTALRITMAAMIPLAIMRILAGDLKGRGRAGLVSICAFAALVATAVLDLTLIPSFGIEGAAAASFGAYSVGAVALLVVFRSVTGVPLMGLVPTIGDFRLILEIATRLLEQALRTAGEAIRRRSKGASTLSQPSSDRPEL